MAAAPPPPKRPRPSTAKKVILAMAMVALAVWLVWLVRRLMPELL